VQDVKMRSQTEVREAAELIAWYVATGGLSRQHPDNANSIIGTIAALEWMQGDEDKNPVAGMLRDLRAAKGQTN
jgi:predicted hydrolase (HD superfamily)